MNTPSEALGNYFGKAVAPHEGMEGVNSRLENANIIKLVMGRTKTAQHVRRSRLYTMSYCGARKQINQKTEQPNLKVAVKKWQLAKKIRNLLPSNAQCSKFFFCFTSKREKMQPSVNGLR